MRLAFRILVNVFVVLAVFEICVRIDDKLKFDAPLLGAYTVDRLYAVENGMLRGKPHARYKEWALNEVGLRGPALASDSIRVLAIGASETFGMLETPGKEFPRQLETLLNETEPRKASSKARIQVANLSYFGLKLSTADALLPEVLRTVRPVTAVIYPSYGSYVSRQTAEPVGDDVDNPQPLFRLPEKLGDLAKSVMPTSIQTAARKWSIERYVGERTPIERVPDNRIEFLIQDLNKVVSTLRGNGVRPVLLTHATRFSGNLEASDRDFYLLAWRKFYPLYSAQALLDMDERMNEAVRQFAQTNGIQLIDIAKLMPGEPRYFTDHVHFTNEGASLMAKLIADRLGPLTEPRVSDAGLNVRESP